MTAAPAPPSPSLLQRLRYRVGLVLLREDVRGQGAHVDPEDPDAPVPAPPASRVLWRVLASPTIERFADALRPPGGGTVRAGVVEDLAEYHHMSPDQVVQRCLRWEEESVEEWRAAGGDSPEGLSRFYDSVQSWSFDLLWYAYLQTAGYGYPMSVIVADWLGPPRPGARMLDLGSGVGVTAQLFAALGYQVTLADVSTPLLDFARRRLARRSIAADHVHLPADLPEGAFDLVTAVDVMVHIPDVAATARQLHAALRPGGLLVTNFDVRRRAPGSGNDWHLYEDDLPLRWAVERTGFRQVAYLDGIIRIYRAVPAVGSGWRLLQALAWVRLASPPARAVRRLRRWASRVLLQTARRLRGRPSVRAAR
jgi:2-polyprenyl-3-methyl-5-hydroxy-6-metoxy-1,4-benzoquinol methylase